MTVHQLYVALDSLIPSSLSAEWDNDGLMVCPCPDREVRNVLLSLDCDEDAEKEAHRIGADVIVTHHPLIFRRLPAITDSGLIGLIKSDISVMSFHTRLDALDGGVNDRLADMLGLTNISKFAENCGRIGELEYSWDAEIFADMLKKVTGANVIKAAVPCDVVQRVAVVSGSGGDFTDEAFSLGADTFVSGEIGYHHMLDSHAAGMNAFEIGHYCSEIHTLSLLEELIRSAGYEGNIEKYPHTNIEAL